MAKRQNIDVPAELPLGDQIVQLLSSSDYRPLDKVELSKALGLHSSDRRRLRDVLQELEVAGSIARIRKDRYVLPETAQLATGRIEFHRNGSAHVITEREGQADVYIASEHTDVALHGDRVVVRIEADRRNLEPAAIARLEGRVIRIVARGTTRMVGTLQKSPRFFYVVPDDPRIPKDVYVEDTPAAHIGDKVVVRIDTWTNRHTNPEGTIVETLGPADAPGVDMLSIIKKHGLPERFPDEVLNAAEAISDKVTPAELAAREDCRHLDIVTIDPDDAKDFDDAILVEKTTHGWHLQVHIADVSHYVQPGGVLDREAHSRGNSTYLVDRVIPMLPERLSNGICSLKPQVERLTFAAFIDFDHEGRMKRSRFVRAVIRSAHRFTYKQAFAQLQLAKPDPKTDVPAHLHARLHTAWELASILRLNRFNVGSLDLDFPEVKVILDEHGKATRLEKIENDISHQLIEEFMLAANEAVAGFLKNRQAPSIYRVHEKPDPSRLKEFREVALEHGIRIGNPEVRSELQKALRLVTGQPEEFAVKLALLRRLKRAAYSTDPIGHYGLSKVNYTHFTSPIRRYADLVVHRSLAFAMETVKERGADPGEQRAKKAKPAALRDLGETASHISKTERLSAEAESDSVALKKYEYFERQMKSRTPQPFRAVVSEVRSYGLVVELPDAGQSGLIHVSTLGGKGDFYQYDAMRHSFHCRGSQQRYSLGDELQVIVSRVDRMKRQVDFVPTAEQAPREAKKGKPPQKPREAKPPRSPRTEGAQAPASKHRQGGPRPFPAKGRRKRTGRD